ncbi:MAG: tetratricopeptide repeat protein [Longimonas sp.]|uniref:tetratricopeptide repeat protein n=1 Tax=Longimonas sp. TaxID=2039626 RepID=UPI00397723EC
MPTSTHTVAAVLLGLLLLGLGLSGCDFLDPTEVENPQSTEDDLEGTPDLVNVFLPGLEAQFARALGSTVVTTEIASDNYSINGTGLGGTAMDFPERITPTTAVINSRAADVGSYWNLQELRALADYVLTEILPEDEDASDADVALVHYYRGMAFLMQAENFSAVPIEEDDTPRPAAELYTLAEAAFQESRSLNSGSSNMLRTSAALARLHRGVGNPQEASDYAQEAVEIDDDFVIEQGFDEQNLVNAPHIYLVTRSIKEMQPLPRLDFLDPKYTSREAGIAVAKAEEMYLIQAEAALVEGNPDAARGFLSDALSFSQSRLATEFDDNDARLDNNLNPRPQSVGVKIAFEPDAPFQQGLVLNRPGIITTPTVSATSITAPDIDAATGDELVRLLYQMRQEVLFLEGRRLHDLGLRLPMMLPELEQNPTIAAGDLGTETIIPAYIPPANEMDLYTPVEIYEEQEDEDGNDILVLVEDEITMLHDMNRILAEERGLVMQNPRLP